MLPTQIEILICSNNVMEPHSDVPVELFSSVPLLEPDGGTIQSLLIERI